MEHLIHFTFDCICLVQKKTPNVRTELKGLRLKARKSNNFDRNIKRNTILKYPKNSKRSFFFKLCENYLKWSNVYSISIFSVRPDFSYFPQNDEGCFSSNQNAPNTYQHRKLPLKVCMIDLFSIKVSVRRPWSKAWFLEINHYKVNPTFTCALWQKNQIRYYSLITNCVKPVPRTYYEFSIFLKFFVMGRKDLIFLF